MRKPSDRAEKIQTVKSRVAKEVLFGDIFQYHCDEAAITLLIAIISLAVILPSPS